MAAVVSSNPFAILSEDTAVPPATSPAPEKAKTETPAARGGQRGRSGPASRGGRYYQRGGGAPSTPRETAEADDAPPREAKRFGDERGRVRARGRGRGERGDRRGGGHGRVYDRQSATGKTDSDKKIAQGWGGPDADKELQAEEEGTKDAAEETPADDPWGTVDTNAAAPAADDPWGAVPAPESSGDAAKEVAPAETRRPREEEEDNTLTLDQYQAKLKESSTVPKLENVRRPNDGADDLFKDAIQVVKPEENAYYVPKTKAQKQRAKSAKEEKKQVATELFFDGPFADRQTRGGRGGRGGERGARGSGRGRGGRGGRGRGDGANGQSVNLRDESDFPSLSKS
ncbi:hypothetical protein ACEPAI_697 [Sanghuangporus weigelae]